MRVSLILWNHLLLLGVLVLLVKLVRKLLRSLIVVINLLVQLLVLKLGSIFLVGLQCLRWIIVRLAKMRSHILIYTNILFTFHLLTLIEGFLLAASFRFSHVVLLRGLAASSINASSLTLSIIVTVSGPIDAITEGLATSTEDGERPKPFV